MARRHTALPWNANDVRGSRVKGEALSVGNWPQCRRLLDAMNTRAGESPPRRHEPAIEHRGAQRAGRRTGRCAHTEAADGACLVRAAGKAGAGCRACEAQAEAVVST